MNENYGKANDSQRAHLVDLHEWNTDKSVEPHTMVRGVMGKDHDAATHAWRYLRVSSSGAISNDDADNFRVSSVQKDAGLLRVSALGVDIADVSNEDAADFRMSAIQGDASNLHVSAFIDSGSISAMQSDAGNLMVSGRSDDAALFRVSAIGTLSANESISARLLEGTAFVGNVSAVQPDAGDFRASAIQGDAAFLRISAIGSGTRDGTLIDGLDQSVSAMIVSSRSVDFSNLNLSATPQLAVRPGTENAGEHRVSAFSDDAGIFRVSAVGGTSGDHILVDGLNNTLSAVILENRNVDAYTLCGVSVTRQLMVRCGTKDAAEHRVSTIQHYPSQMKVSAYQDDASNLHVSAKSKDAGTMRVSSIIKGYNGTNYHSVNLDTITRSLTTIEYEHHELHEGHVFHVNFDKGSINTSAVAYLLITTPNSTKWAHIVAHMVVTKGAKLELFEDPTVDPVGTVVDELNHDRNSGTTADVVVTHTPTVSVDGTLLDVNLAGTAGKYAVGGEVNGRNEWILHSNEQYLLKVTSLEDANLVILNVDWYEHTNLAT